MAMKLLVDPGVITPPREEEVVAIRAYKWQGSGDAITYYEAKLASNGKWVPFKKKDNPRAKLPKANDLCWTKELKSVSGFRGIYKLISNEYAV